MMEDEFNKLAQYFAKFPGIGERQSKRFVNFILSADPSYVSELSKLIENSRKNVSRCQLCYRFFKRHDSPLCVICSNPKREKDTLLVVEKDADLESMEKSRIYKGQYFVLGGLVPLVEKDTPNRVRLNELANRISNYLMIVNNVWLIEILIQILLSYN